MNAFKQVLSSVALALMLAGSIGCVGSADQSSTGEYIDDTVITTRVKAAILKHPDLTSSEINVETFRSVVQLSGFVGSQAEINTALALVRNMEGVQSVKNNMQLR